MLRTRTAIRKPGVLRGSTLKNQKALSADPSRARYIGACEKGEKDEGGELARLTRAPTRARALPQAMALASLRVESQIACAVVGLRLLPREVGVGAFFEF